VAFLGEDADYGSLLFRMFEDCYQARLNPEILVVEANEQRPPRLSLRAPDLQSRLLNAYAEDAAAIYLKNQLLEIGGSSGSSRKVVSDLESTDMFSLMT
jgi:hypothetical protein